MWLRLAASSTVWNGYYVTLLVPRVDGSVTDLSLDWIQFRSTEIGADSESVPGSLVCRRGRKTLPNQPSRIVTFSTCMQSLITSWSNDVLCICSCSTWRYFVLCDFVSSFLSPDLPLYALINLVTLSAIVCSKFQCISWYLYFWKSYPVLRTSCLIIMSCLKCRMYCCMLPRIISNNVVSHQAAYCKQCLTSTVLCCMIRKSFTVRSSQLPVSLFHKLC